jgi:hypothetical protein
MVHSKDLEFKGTQPELEKDTGLAKLVFQFGTIGYEVVPKAEKHPDSVLPLYSVPVFINFPSGAKLDRYGVYDADKKVFINSLVEDNEMEKYLPGEIPEFQETKQDWYEKWDSYKMHVSVVFSILVNANLIRLDTAPRAIEEDNTNS